MAVHPCSPGQWANHGACPAAEPRTRLIKLAYRTLGPVSDCDGLRTAVRGGFVTFIFQLQQVACARSALTSLRRFSKVLPYQPEASAVTFATQHRRHACSVPLGAVIPRLLVCCGPCLFGQSISATALVQLALMAPLWAPAYAEQLQRLCWAPGNCCGLMHCLPASAISHAQQMTCHNSDVVIFVEAAGHLQDATDCTCSHPSMQHQGGLW